MRHEDLPTIEFENKIKEAKTILEEYINSITPYDNKPITRGVLKYFKHNHKDEFIDDYEEGMAGICLEKALIEEYNEGNIFEKKDGKYIIEMNYGEHSTRFFSLVKI